MTSSRKGGSLRKDRGDDSGTTKQEQSRAMSTSKDESRKHSKTRDQEKKLRIQERKCVPARGRVVAPGRNSTSYVPHEYNPYHHTSLDKTDGLADDVEPNLASILDHGLDHISEESTTVLTPSYDTTSLTPTIRTYFDEDEEWNSYSPPMSPYSNTTHDLKFVGCWAEMDESLVMLPSYMQAMSLAGRYTPRRDVREAMVGIKVAFPKVEQSQVNVYGTVRR